MNRNNTIDIARYVLAFMVVVIHVPFFFKTEMIPLLRCAVPFFYMITGFYLYNNKEESRTKQKILNSAKKWFYLWAKYFILSTLLVQFFNLCISGSIYWELDDIRRFLLHGNCDGVDIIYINGERYGTSVLWFLLQGAIALYIFYLMPSSMYGKLGGCISCCLYFFFLCLNFKLRGTFAIPRLFTIALPAIIVGYCINKYRGLWIARLNLLTKMLLCFLSLVFLYAEAVYLKYNHGYINEIYIFNLPLVSLLFMTLTEIKINNLGAVIIQKIGTKATMDIYLWHRWLYMVFVILGIKFGNFDALVCYIFLFAVSVLFRNLKNKNNVKSI